MKLQLQHPTEQKQIIYRQSNESGPGIRTNRISTSDYITAVIADILDVNAMSHFLVT